MFIFYIALDNNVKFDGGLSSAVAEDFQLYRDI